jgi:hypothetical protein
MKPNIPAGNAIIATPLFFIIIAFCYLIKLVFIPKQVIRKNN